MGHKLSDVDHVEAIFNGLPEEYDTFVISVDSKPESYSAEEIESLLLAQEARIEKHSKDHDSASINLATHKKHYKGGFTNTPGSSSSYQSHGKDRSNKRWKNNVFPYTLN